MLFNRGELHRLSIQILHLGPKLENPNEYGYQWFEPRIIAPSIRDLLSSPETYIKGIPQDKRVNIFFTVNESREDGICPRLFKQTNTIAFEIMGIEPAKEQGYIDVAHRVLQVPHGEQIAWISRGETLTCLINIDDYQSDISIFKSRRTQYEKICDDLLDALKEASLPGELNLDVFSSAAILPLPGTIFKEDGEQPEPVRLVSGAMSPISWDWGVVSGLLDGSSSGATKSETVSKEYMKHMGVPDTQAILQGCDFLNFCKASPDKLLYTEWLMMLSILQPLEGGVKLAHDYSFGYNGYTPQKLNDQLQKVALKGAYTCESINKSFNKCHGCDYFGKVTTPLQIVSNDYIKTAATGFHKRYEKADGQLGMWKPVYEDLRRQFERERRYKTFSNSKAVFVYGPDPKWTELDEAWIENYAQTKFVIQGEHVTNNGMASEFKGLVRRTNIVGSDWFIKNSERKFNFKNCVYDLSTSQSTEHRPEYGMTYILPYDYEPDAKAPRFEKFLLEMTCNRPELSETLIEYMSYCLSGDTCWAHKALLLYGGGRNGKSLFLKILQSLVTPDAYSAMMINDLEKDTNRFQLNNKLFNIGEETPDKALTESAMFKNLVAGGIVEMRPIYGKPITVQNKTKFIFASNTLPKIYNIGLSITERILIVPCEAEFTQSKGNQNPYLYEEILPERSGIMNLVIKAYHRLKARGEFVRLKILDETMESLKLENDHIYIFYKSHLSVDNSDTGHERRDIYQQFCNWCEFNNFKEVSSKIFWRELRKEIKNLDKREYRPHGQRERIAGVTVINAQDFT